MPRVENKGENVADWYNAPGCSAGSSTYDVCRNCADDLLDDAHAHDDKLVPYNGDPQGVDGWEEGAAHPAYDGVDYECAVCRAPLSDENDD